VILRALILVVLLISSALHLFSEETVADASSPLPNKHYYGEDPTPSFLDEHYYFKVGSSIPLVQTIGVGKRWNHFETLRGNDFCIGIKGVPITTLPIGLVYTEYTRLFYKPFNPDNDYYKYSGFGLEIGFWFIAGNRLGTGPTPYLNPKIVWGKELQRGRFSQWSCNLIPTALFLFVIGDLLTHSEPCDLAQGLAIIMTGGYMFEYSFGF